MTKRDRLTIGELAKASGLSRSTLLYYDRIGLLRPRVRTAARYRLYSGHDAKRLEMICLHRGLGIPLKEIRMLLDQTGGSAPAEILKRRLKVLELEISNLRRQQQTIVKFLKDETIRKEGEMVDKKRWIEIMRAAGLSDDDMNNWHLQFEKLEPDAHQEFLESLGIEATEIRRIREHFQKELAQKP